MMKREYSKPDVFFDNFSLCTSIAGNCEVKTDLKSQGECYVQFGALKVFTDRVVGCSKYGIVIENGQFNGLCYHVPTENANLFMS